jgi:hypothetical protein
MRINPKNSLTLIGVFYNYFLTDNTDLHGVVDGCQESMCMRRDSVVGSIFLSEKVVEQPGIAESVYSRCVQLCKGGKESRLRDGFEGCHEGVAGSLKA